jgi:hypothetical protein
MEESPVAMRGLRAGEPVSASQPAGSARGVVSLEAGKRACRDQTDKQRRAFFGHTRFKNEEIRREYFVVAKSGTYAEVP